MNKFCALLLDKNYGDCICYFYWVTSFSSRLGDSNNPGFPQHFDNLTIWIVLTCFQISSSSDLFSEIFSRLFQLLLSCSTIFQFSVKFLVFISILTFFFLSFFLFYDNGIICIIVLNFYTNNYRWFWVETKWQYVSSVLKYSLHNFNWF